MDQFLSKHHSKFAWLMDWVYLLVMINLMAVAGTVVGFGILGIFPAWMTAHQLIKKRLNHEDFALGKTFIKTYKTMFWKANALGYVLLSLGAVILLSWFYYVRDLSSTLHWIGLIGVGFLALIWLLMMGIVPISFVYFPKFKMKEHLKFTLIMTFGMPGLALVIFLNSLFFYAFVMIRFISIFPFLAFTLPALVNLLFARKKLLKLFTIFKDEHVMIRTLNSYGNDEGLWLLWDKSETKVELDHDLFMAWMNDETKINRRASLVLTNQKEEPLGMMLTRVVDQEVYIEVLFVDASYQKRGYGKQMIHWLEKVCRDAEIERIHVGSDESIFETLPRPLNMSLSFFHKQGFIRSETETGFRLKKNLGGRDS